jgi:hypothetical protein
MCEAEPDRRTEVWSAFFIARFSRDYCAFLTHVGVRNRLPIQITPE